MRLILLGPPGAGKGTQAGRVAERFGVPHIATGDLFRAAVRDGTPVGLRAKAYMDRGELVPDEVVLEMLAERLARPDAAAGFLLDGFPRTLPQADALGETLAKLGHHVDVVVNFEVPDEVIVERISTRRSCPKCGRVYNATTSPSIVDRICDVDGQALLQRDDDKAEVVLKRLQVFHEQTEPLIAYYSARDLLLTVDGVGPVDEVHQRIVKEIEAR